MRTEILITVTRSSVESKRATITIKGQPNTSVINSAIDNCVHQIVNSHAHGDVMEITVDIQEGEGGNE